MSEYQINTHNQKILLHFENFYSFNFYFFRFAVKFDIDKFIIQVILYFNKK